MKKVLVVLMLLPLFFCCNDDKEEKTPEQIAQEKLEQDKRNNSWKYKEYHIRFEISAFFLGKSRKGYAPNVHCNICKVNNDFEKETIKFRIESETINIENPLNHIHIIKPEKEVYEFNFYQNEYSEINNTIFQIKLYVNNELVDIYKSETIESEGWADKLTIKFNFKSKEVIVKNKVRKFVEKTKEQLDKENAWKNKTYRLRFEIKSLEKFYTPNNFYMRHNKSYYRQGCGSCGVTLEDQNHVGAWNTYYKCSYKTSFKPDEEEKIQFPFYSDRGRYEIKFYVDDEFIGERKSIKKTLNFIYNFRTKKLKIVNDAPYLLFI